MSNLPLISVIIPVYNAEKTITACVESLVSQDYKNHEILLINDGSKDSSPSIIDELAVKYGNVFSYHYKNAGAAEARNRGILRAKGELIAFVDSDDLVLPNYLSYLYGLMSEYNTDISVCSYTKLYANKRKKIYGSSSIFSEIYNTEKASTNTDYRVAYKRESAVTHLLYQRNFISSPWAMLSKRSLWDNVSFPKGKRAEDMATIYRLFAAADSVAYGDKKLYLYILRKTNTIYSTSKLLNPDYLAHCKNMVSFIDVSMPVALPAAKSRLFSACFQILSETPDNSENHAFITDLYKTVNEIKKDVLLDPKGKLRNRVAALISCFSVKFLHAILRFYYLSNKAVNL